MGLSTAAAIAGPPVGRFFGRHLGGLFGGGGGGSNPATGQALGLASRFGQQAGQSGGQLFQQGQQNLAGVNQFFQPALLGDRTALRRLTEGQAQREQDLSRGATRAIRESGAPAGVRELAEAQERSRLAGSLGTQDNEIQAQAAQLLANLGLGQTGQGLSALGGAGGLHVNLFQALQAGDISREQFGAEQSAKTFESLGSGLFEAIQAFRNRGGGGGAGAGTIPTTPHVLDARNFGGNPAFNPFSTPDARTSGQRFGSPGTDFLVQGFGRRQPSPFDFLVRGTRAF